MSSCNQSVSVAKVGTEKQDYLDEVDFGKTFVVPRLLDVKNGNNVLMVEVS